jgi:hypothetical protein
MAVNGKQKGNEAERELAKILSSALGGTFTRSNGSGAFVGGKNAHRKAGLGKSQMQSLKGDLCPPDELPRLVVESKFYNPAKVSYEKMLWSPVKILDGWIAQARSSIDSGDLWIVCWKTNMRPWMVVMDELEFDRMIGTHQYVRCARYIGEDGRPCVMMPLAEFLEERWLDAIRERCAPAD